jgi:DNA invertase Pin-like site-specific DNA recombinase
MKAAGYCRVSSQDQVEGTSLDAQRDQIEAYAKMKNVELVAVFIDAGVSGGKPISGRPEGRKLVELLGRGEIEAVIIVKLDRAFRNTVDCLQTTELWEEKGISLHITDLGGNSVDTSSPAGRFMLTVLAAAAEMERGMIRDRCNSGRKVKKAQGFRIGEIPYGYDLEDPENLENTRLKENPREQEILCMVQRLREQGQSLRAIAESLNEQGIQAKKGGAWSYGQIQSLLKTVKRAA